MKNLIQYVSKVSRLFHSYLREEIDTPKLINELRVLEQYHRGLVQDNEGRAIWFKFSKDDTGCTTIDELAEDLRFGNKNKHYILDQMKSAISLQGELLIYFS